MRLRHLALNLKQLCSFTFLALALLSVECAAATYTVLHAFNGTNGDSPQSTLVRAKDGNYYGTTFYGGAYGPYGTVYQLTATGIFTSIHSFNNTDGRNPSGLIVGKDGYLYGTTTTGGAYGFGTVFKISTTGVLTTLHEFTGGADGAGNGAALALGADGNYYGTTLGGANGLGTTFKITRTGVFTTLHTFGAAPDGSLPRSGLIRATNGNFYGTTSQGGADNVGTVYQMTTAGVVTVLHSFFYTDESGIYPWAGLVQGKDGLLYGSASSGGWGGGGLYKISTTGTFTLLTKFGTGFSGGVRPGAYPYSSMIQAADGYFYGTTQYTDPYTLGGTVYKMSADGTIFSDAWTMSLFVINNGVTPIGGLIESRTRGTFYGTTTDGGANGYGVIFSLLTP